MSLFVIHRLTDLQSAAPLTTAAREEGFGFLDRLVAEWESGATRFDRPDEALFGAYLAGTLVGIGGLTHQRAGLGRVRRLYVHPDYRGRGAAGRLMIAILDVARQHYPEVVLSTDNPVARGLYEQMGFRTESLDGTDRATHRLSLSPK